MQQAELNQQADRIELLLQDHKVPARVTGGNVTPRWVQFWLQPAPGIKVNKVEALSHEIAIALGAPVARVKAENGVVKVKCHAMIRNSLNLTQLMARLPANRIPLGTAVLGLAHDGAPLLVRLPSPDVAHLLVAGTTGSGKTALVQTMIMSLALLHHRRQLQFASIDPTPGRPTHAPSEHGVWGRTCVRITWIYRILRPIITQPDQAVDALLDIVKLMETRD